MDKSQIIVVAGIISFDSKILIVQRSLDKSDLQPGLWEFPGGKIEFGEDPKAALKREIMEELNLEISHLELFDVTSGMLRKDGKELHAVMIIYKCQADVNSITLNSGNDYKWIFPDYLKGYKYAKLDIPVIEKMTR